MPRRRTDDTGRMDGSGSGSGSTSALFEDVHAGDSDLEGANGVVTTEIATVEHHPVAPVQPNTSVMQLISDLARDPQADVEKFGQLLTFKERLEARDAEIEFNRAMARLAPKLPVIKKKGTIDMGGKGKIKFARYEDLDRAIRPILAEEGFTLSFSSKPVAGGVLMVCTLAHVLGHSKQSEMQMPPDGGPGRNALQAIGSARSYAKRYLCCDILNIITEGQDDDGNATSYLTDEQADAITTMIDACEMRGDARRRFLAFAQAESVERIQQADFDRCMEALKKKAQQMREGK